MTRGGGDDGWSDLPLRCRDGVVGIEWLGVARFTGRWRHGGNVASGHSQRHLCTKEPDSRSRTIHLYGNWESRISNGERGETVEYRDSLLIDGADLSSDFIPANTLSYGAPAGGVDCREGEDVSGMLSHELSPFHLFTYLYVGDLPFESVRSAIVVLLRISSEHSAHWTEDIRDSASEL